MTSQRTWAGAIVAVAGFPFRVLYRCTLYLITVLFLGFAYALGGVPRIEKPEPKNRITDTNRR